jgi:hypothetical protein
MRLKNDEQPKVLLTKNEEGEFVIDPDFLKVFQEEKKFWKLVRENDGLENTSKDVLWLEWNSDGTFKEKFSEPAVGRSLLMSPFNQFFTWQTTIITEIIEEKEGYLKFKTKNSNYELSRIQEQV